jgi:WD40 repeat protein
MLIFEKNKENKALRFVESIENISHNHQLFFSFCNNLKNKLEIEASLASIKELFDLDNEHTESIRSVHFSPDNNMLATGSDDKTVHIWDVAANECTNILKGHTMGVISVFFSPDGAKLVSGSCDQTICIWNLAISRCIGTIQVHSAVHSLCYSVDGTLLAYPSRKSISIINAQTYKRVQAITTDNFINAIALSADNTKVIAGGDAKKVQIFDISQGTCLQEFNGHSEKVNSVCFVPNTNNTHFLSSSDKTIRFWDFGKNRSTHIIKGTGPISAISADGTLIASVASANTLKLYNAKTGNYLKSFSLLNDPQKFSRNGKDIMAMCFSSDRKRLAVATRNKGIFIITFPDIKKEFTLQSLLSLSCSMHKEAQKTSQL